MNTRARRIFIGLLLIAVLVIVIIGLLTFPRKSGTPGASPSSHSTVSPAPSLPAANAQNPPALAPSPTRQETQITTNTLADLPPTPFPSATSQTASNDFTLWLVGIIRDESGNPIEDAEVTLAQNRMFFPLGDGGGGRPYVEKRIQVDHIRSDPTGRYEMQLPDQFPYVVMAQTPGRTPAANTLYPQHLHIQTDDKGRRVIQVDLTLAPGTLFSGHVVDQNNSPVPQAKVEARPLVGSEIVFGRTTMNLETATQDDGTFSLAIPPRVTSFPIRLSKPGYTLVEYRVEDSTQVKDWTLSTFGGSISGRVIRETDQQPVPGAEVTAYASKPRNMSNPDPLSLSTTADAQGNFTLRPLGENTWDVVANTPEQRPLGIPASGTVQVALGPEQRVDNIEILIPPPLMVSGLVLDATTQAPVPDARVYHMNWNREETEAATTDHNGRFVLPALSISPEQWSRIRTTLKARKDGFLTGTVDKEMPDVSKHTLQETISLTPRRSIRVSGRVLDFSGAAAPNVLVLGHYATYPESRGFTDLAGQFGIPALANFDLDLEFHPPEGPTTYAKRIKTADESICGIEIHLDPGGNLQVLVLSPDGKPVEDAHVIFIRRTYWSGPRISGNGMSRAEMKMSGDDGTALFKNLISTDAQLEPRLNRASVDIEATHPDYDPAEENGVCIEPATLNRLELKLLPKDASAEIDGVVRDPEGHPIEGVHVQVYGFSHFKTTATDPLGYFEFKDLRPGDYNLQFNHPNYRWVSKSITAPQNDVEVQMQKVATNSN